MIINPYYNGKLSGVKWMSKDASGTSSYERAFRYYYDALNRDTAAIYAERTAASTSAFATTNGWNENRITYDQNGNLLTLFRDSTSQGSGGHTPIDNLTYTYDTNNPNQLQKVTDGTGAQYTNSGFRNRTGSTSRYTYDGNGNLTNEPYKGFSSIAYNVLNRTDRITFTVSANRYIDYTYDASGNLIRKRQYDNVGGVATLQNTTDYIDGFVYTTVSSTQTLQYFPMSEGRVLNSAGTLSLEYSITDQQGNVRIAFDNSGTGGTAKVRQENSYYSFGLIMPGSTVTTPTNPNKHLYNGGSEWQNDFSNLPDYYQTYNRNYDAALGRWIGVDPMADSAESMSSYQYARNNPIMYNDPFGDLSQAQWNMVVNYVNNGIMGDYSISDNGDENRGGGGDDDISNYAVTPGTAFGNVVKAITEDNGWGYTVAGNLQTAYNNFSNKLTATSGNKINSTSGFAIYVNMDGDIVTQTGTKKDYVEIQNSNYSWQLTQVSYDATQGGIRDMTSQFDKQLQITQAFFSSISHIYDSLDPGSRYTAKLLLFAQLVKTGAPFDLKNGAYSKSLIGPISLYHGEQLIAGDYGQINFGVAAKAFGISLEMAIFGAGVNQIFQGKPDWSNPAGFFDASEETPMIIRGYNMIIK